MKSNEFSITGANVYTEKKPGAGRVLEFKEQAEALVTPLNELTANCVTIMIGIASDPAAGKLALWIDLDRATSLRLSDEMLRAIGARSPSPRIDGTAMTVDAWDDAHKPYLHAQGVDFRLGAGWDGRYGQDHWSIYMERQSARGLIEVSAHIHFDNANARILAELLRVMPFR
jgi:hypothetical protein